MINYCFILLIPKIVMVRTLSLELCVGKFGLYLSLMSKVFTNDKGITNGYDGRTNPVKD